MADFSASTPTPASQTQAANINAFAPGGCPAGIEPRIWRQELETHIEQHLAVVTGLLALLDDGLDPDLEPSLAGGPETDDLEADGLELGELDTADDEPSLAAPEPSYGLAAIYWPPTGALYAPALPLGSQAGWAAGGPSDLEDEHDGLEPENEHGSSWSESGSSAGHLDGTFGEDDEQVNEDGDETGSNGEDGPTWAEAIDQTTLRVRL